MPIRYVAPEVRTCDYCGARTRVPKGLDDRETKRILEGTGWTYDDFILLCPHCTRLKHGKATLADRIPLVRRFVR